MTEFEKYTREAEEKWGNTEAYKEHSDKTKGYSKQKWDSLAERMNEIMASFASCRNNGSAPDSPEAQTLVESLRTHITENYYNCTPDILSGLGKMYVADERFKKNIDKYGDGTADFVRNAIAVYCKE